jgi:hypothetical protein
MLEEDSHVRELAAPYVLGALEPDEVEQVELHLLECAECRSLVEAERRVADLLPFLAEPIPVPARARRNLLERFQTPAPLESEDDSRSRVVTLLTRLGWVAAISAAFVAVFLGWNSTQMQNQVNKKNSELSVLTQNQQTIAQFVSSPNGFVTSLQNTGVASGAQGGVILNPTRNAALLVVEGLPKPPTGHSYVVWMVRGNEHVNAGVLPVDSQGRGTLYITMSEALASFDGILVTEEAGARVSNPSGTRMLAAHVNN